MNSPIHSCAAPAQRGIDTVRIAHRCCLEQEQRRVADYYLLTSAHACGGGRVRREERKRGDSMFARELC